MTLRLAFNCPYSMCFFSLKLKSFFRQNYVSHPHGNPFSESYYKYIIMQIARKKRAKCKQFFLLHSFHNSICGNTTTNTQSNRILNCENFEKQNKNQMKEKQNNTINNKMWNQFMTWSVAHQPNIWSQKGKIAYKNSMQQQQKNAVVLPKTIYLAIYIPAYISTYVHVCVHQSNNVKETSWNMLRWC